MTSQITDIKIIMCSYECTGMRSKGLSCLCDKHLLVWHLAHLMISKQLFLYMSFCILCVCACVFSWGFLIYLINNSCVFLIKMVPKCKKKYSQKQLQHDNQH